MRRRNRRSLVAPVAVGGRGGRDGGKRPLQTGNMRPIDNDNILPAPLIYTYTRFEHIVCIHRRDTYAFRFSVESERNWGNRTFDHVYNGLSYRFVNQAPWYGQYLTEIDRLRNHLSLLSQLTFFFFNYFHPAEFDWKMSSKSFTIDHILHGPSAPAVDPLTTSVGDHSTYPDVHPQQLVSYWTGDPAAYYPPSGWPNAAAIWFQSQQHHAMPVDLSTGAQRPVPTTTSIGPHSSIFDNVNWMAMPSAAMTGCWPSAGSPELSYSHHGKKKKKKKPFSNSFSQTVGAPFLPLSSWEFVFLSALLLQLVQVWKWRKGRRWMEQSKTNRWWWWRGGTWLLCIDDRWGSSFENKKFIVRLVSWPLIDGWISFQDRHGKSSRVELKYID